MPITSFTITPRSPRPAPRRSRAESPDVHEQGGDPPMNACACAADANGAATPAGTPGDLDACAARQRNVAVEEGCRVCCFKMLSLQAGLPVSRMGLRWFPL
jgi:hypothetical protein